jgi:hypothetical protein
VAGVVVVAGTEVDLVEVDEDVVEVEGGSVEANGAAGMSDVGAGMFGVVVDSIDPVEVQALNTTVAAMATPARHGRRLASTTPSDQRRGLTANPKTPGVFSSDLISSCIEGVSSWELTRQQLVFVSLRFIPGNVAFDG